MDAVKSKSCMPFT